MLKSGEAYKIYPPTDIIKKAFGEEYNKKEGIVICTISEGKCPYEMEGKRMLYGNAEKGEVSICTSDGLVEKLNNSAEIIPLRDPPEIKIDSDKPNPRNRRF